MSNQNQNKVSGATVADVAATKDAKPATSKADYPAKANVKSASGNRTLHQVTDVVIDGRPTKIDIDAFARAQLDAGKWVIVTD